MESVRLPGVHERFHNDSRIPSSSAGKRARLRPTGWRNRLALARRMFLFINLAGYNKPPRRITDERFRVCCCARRIETPITADGLALRARVSPMRPFTCTARLAQFPVLANDADRNSLTVNSRNFLESSEN